MKNNKLSIVIPTFNGLSLLKKHLPQVIKYSPAGTEIIIVDDGSIDNTVDWLKNDYPAVICIHNPKNLGFTKSVNKAVSQVSSDFFLLLNNDVAVTKDYLSSALKYFEDPNIFAVTLNETHSSWPVITYSGKLNYTRAEDKSKAYYSGWASGGSAIFRTNVWRDLGGFDDIYSPGYWEDIDIGYRAWKAGYSIVWDPKSQVIHEHESTFNKYNRSHLNLIKQRNELIFNWKNITDSDLKANHFWFLVSYTLRHPGYLKIIISALFALPLAKKTTVQKRTDKEVISLVNLPV